MARDGRCGRQRLPGSDQRGVRTPRYVGLHYRTTGFVASCGMRRVTF